jgi:hypothetical protein
MPQQCHRQHDSTSTSHHDQVTLATPSPAWLESTVTSMTWHLNRVVTMLPRQHHRQYDSTSISRRGHVSSEAPLHAWLDIYIASQPCHLDNAVASMTRQHRHKHDSTSISRCDQVTLVAPLLTQLSSDITQQLDHQHQRHAILMASRYVVSSYWYYSPIYLVSGPIQAYHCAAWHLHDASTFWRITFEHYRLLS